MSNKIAITGAPKSGKTVLKNTLIEKFPQKDNKSQQDNVIHIDIKGNDSFEIFVLKNDVERVYNDLKYKSCIFLTVSLSNHSDHFDEITKYLKFINEKNISKNVCILGNIDTNPEYLSLDKYKNEYEDMIYSCKMNYKNIKFLQYWSFDFKDINAVLESFTQIANEIPKKVDRSDNESRGKCESCILC